MKNMILILLILFPLTVCRGKANMNGQVAMIMIEKTMDFSQKNILKKMKELFGDNLKAEKGEVKDKVLIFQAGQLRYTISEMPMAIPQGDLEFPINTAWYWPTAATEVKRHSRHLILFVTGSQDKIEISKALTKLASSFLDSKNAIGVYWGSSAQVIQRDLFLDYAKLLNQDSLPIPIWVKTTGYQNPDKTFYLYTVGLVEYGQREFEIEKFQGGVSEGSIFLLDLAQYVIKNGPVIKDGDTVGGSETQKIKVKYKKSSLHKEEDVISVIY